MKKWMCFLVHQEDIKDNKLSYCVGTKEKTIEIYANKDNAKTFTATFFDYFREYEVPTKDMTAAEYKQKVEEIVAEAQKEFETWLKEQKEGVEQNTQDLYGDKTYVMMNFVQHPLIFKINTQTSQIVAYTRIAFDSFSVDEINEDHNGKS